MKLLVLIAVLVLVMWLARGLGKGKTPAPPPQPGPQPGRPGQDHEDMVSCTQCGLHLPRSEALPGRGGVFCSESHRSTYEKQRGA